MMPHRIVLLVAGIGLAAACASAPPGASAHDPTGCWYFERDDAARALNLPWGVRLTADTLTGWPAIERRGGARRAATLTPDGDADHPFGYWMALPGDSIEIGYPGGGGLLLRLAAGDVAMTGEAHALGDVLAPGAPPRPVRTVRLARAQCP